MAVRRIRRADPLTLDQLMLRVRRQVGDVIDDAIPGAGDRRWEDEAICDALNDMMAEMYQELSVTPENILTEQSITYTGGAESFDLTVTQPAYVVYGVYQESPGGGVPTLLRYVPFLLAERFRTDGSDASPDTERVWTLRDNQLLLRPIPTSDLSLTVLLVGRPFSMDVATGNVDNHPFPVVHEELMVLGAANRLQYPNDQLPIGRLQHYNKLWTNWVQDCERYQGPKFPVDSRRFR